MQKSRVPFLAKMGTTCETHVDTHVETHVETHDFSMGKTHDSPLVQAVESVNTVLNAELKGFDVSKQKAARLGHRHKGRAVEVKVGGLDWGTCGFFMD